MSAGLPAVDRDLGQMAARLVLAEEAAAVSRFALVDLALLERAQIALGPHHGSLG